ncbi:uncharacterized protein V1516DRAFT_676125 [Lipomyces oligophaga]|uniref:uncharacterized protein n=1 Tax=Lipomyces oligophaga TaxID=45792 RepID=UPI0034CD9F3A
MVGPKIFALLSAVACAACAGLQNLASPPVNSLQDIDPIATSNIIEGTIQEYYYLERAVGTKGTDEAVILLSSDHVASISNDHGATWKAISTPADVLSIIPHPFNSDWVYLITVTNQIVVSSNRGKTFTTYKTPTAPSTEPVPVLTFHRSRPDWLIWHGSTECSKVPQGEICGTSTAYSKNGGKSWTNMATNTRMCSFITGLQKSTDENLVFCERQVSVNRVQRSFIQLVSTTDFLKNSKNEKQHFGDVIGFALSNDFVFVAAIAEDTVSLNAFVTVDGATFAQAHFPPKFTLQLQQAYTILDTSTHAIFLHVTVDSTMGREFGSILKSNSNGTNYVTSLEYANRDYNGFVDYEKMQSLEGIFTVNVLTNPQEAGGQTPKKLRTMITMSDGASWSYLEPPSTDSLGKPTGCTSASVACSLNLHGYTERIDVRDTYSSASAVGMMIGVGNVGNQLDEYIKGNTFLTSDGGASWKEIKKGTHMWEYGDRGSILVLVPDRVPTNTLSVSYDQGKTWKDFVFYDEQVQVYDISTVPSDTSRKFLIHARLQESYGDRTLVVQIDFTGTTKKQCKVDKNPEKSDFELWSPERAPGQTCIFGHQLQYSRKRPDHFCYIGDQVLLPVTIERNCSCSRHDYECDLNYALANDGTCKLVDGFNPPNHENQCVQNPNQVEWFEPTGYRKIPLSTCDGGTLLDQMTAHPCAGHEDDFNKLHGHKNRFFIFLLVLLPFIMGSVIAWLLFQHYYGQYGHIRLGETDFDMRIGLGTGNGIVKYPVMAVSAVLYVMTAIPVMIRVLIESKFGGRRGMRPSRLYRSRTGESGFSLSTRTSSRGGGLGGAGAEAEGYARVEPSEFDVDDELDGDEDAHHISGRDLSGLESGDNRVLSDDEDEGDTDSDVALFGPSVPSAVEGGGGGGAEAAEWASAGSEGPEMAENTAKTAVEIPRLDPPANGGSNITSSGSEDGDKE